VTKKRDSGFGLRESGIQEQTAGRRQTTVKEKGFGLPVSGGGDRDEQEWIRASGEELLRVMWKKKTVTGI
jgi:hypothetical protein